MTYDFPAALVDRMSYMIEGRGGDDVLYPNLVLTLDIEGYDASDPELVAAAVKAARQAMRDRRFLNSAMGRFTSAMYTNSEIGQKLGGIPKSSVQAIACGRLPERYTPAQRAAFRALIADVVESCRSALDALG